MGRKTYRKVITSPELTEQINKENIKLMNRFLREKNSRCSDTTVANYSSDLHIFFTWNLLENDNKDFYSIKKLEFSDFFIYCLEELKWGSARFQRMKACLSSLSIYVEKYFDEEYPTFRNVILKAIENMPKVARREKTVLTDEEMQGLLDYLFIEKKNYQEACLLALACYSGARKSELLRFTTDNIDENNLAYGDLFIETTEKIKTKGRTKEGKMLYKYILKEEFLPYYHKWLEKRKEIMDKHGKTHNALFIKRNGDPANVDNITGWIEKWNKNYLPENKPFYFHCARHFFVTTLTRKGCTSDFIVALVGWSSSEMCKIYTDISDKEKEWKDIDKLKELYSKIDTEEDEE